MNKESLFKSLRNASRGNFFSIEIDQLSNVDESNIEELAQELEREGKIRLKEYIKRENSVYLNGIIKYATN